MTEFSCADIAMLRSRGPKSYGEFGLFCSEMFPDLCAKFHNEELLRALRQIPDLMTASDEVFAAQLNVNLDRIRPSWRS